ncbi:MAG: Wzt carbohydrate-binding domain-containing protein, partial [Pyrinomonadaceae bacterium]
IGTYLRQGSSSAFQSDHESVRYASIRQESDRLTLDVKYHLPEPAIFPCLGFVVSDPTGNPIFGTNPKFDNVAPLSTPRTSGQISVSIRQPALADGTYYLSLWFGDGVTDFFIGRDCLTFEVFGMTKTQHQRPNMNGYVSPTCEWRID